MLWIFGLVLLSSVAGQMVPQCQCSTFDPCYANIVGVITQCADKWENQECRLSTNSVSDVRTICHHWELHIQLLDNAFWPKCRHSEELWVVHDRTSEMCKPLVCSFVSSTAIDYLNMTVVLILLEDKFLRDIRRPSNWLLFVKLRECYLDQVSPVRPLPLSRLLSFSGTT